MCNQKKKTLDHFYSTHRAAHKALPRLPFGISAHNSILLIPACKQKLKQEVPVIRSIRKRSDDADAKLQDCFASTDWNMFLDSSDDIEEYTTSVIGFINYYTFISTRNQGLFYSWALRIHVYIYSLGTMI